jgi:hypothetical protein
MVILVLRRRLYGKRLRRRKFPQRNKNVAARQHVVDIAISTKTCGKSCGLLLNGPSYARCKGSQVGGDQNLSRNFQRSDSRLRKRIGLRAGFCRRAAPLGCKCGLV